MQNKLDQIIKLRTRQLASCSAPEDALWILEKHMHDLRELQFDILERLSSETEKCNILLPNASIFRKGECYHIRFEAILPFRAKTSCRLICEDLRLSIGKYFDDEDIAIPIFEKAVIVFMHHYTKTKSKLRDYDNLERKAALDSLVPYFVIDDSPMFVRSFDMMVRSDITYTEILIMDWGQFQRFICTDKTLFY